jgi:hypothetical protein
MNCAQLCVSSKVFGFAISIAILAPAAAAQTPPPQAAPSLEIPTLVVDHEHRPVGDLTPGQFSITVDNRAPFAPTAIHQESNDPIALTVLIDASRDSYHDLGQLGDEIGASPPRFFFQTTASRSTRSTAC